MGRELVSKSDLLSSENLESMILYGSVASPCVRRVRITMMEKGIEYDWVEIDLANMEQRSKEYLALNPNGFVPTLAHGSFVVYESGVINEYLEDQFPQKPLIPKDPWQRAQVRMWHSAEAAMAKIFRQLMYQRLMGPVHHVSRSRDEAIQLVRRSTQDEQDINWEIRVWDLKVLNPAQEAEHEKRLMEWLEIVEQGLGEKSFLVGDQFSQADISLFPRISLYESLNLFIDPARFPNVCRWMSNLAKRPSFVNSEPVQAQKLRKLARSSLFRRFRAGLLKPSQSRSFFERTLVWGFGRLFRKIFKVEQLLHNPVRERSLPLPKSTQPAARSVELGNSDTEPTQFELFGDRRSPHTQRIILLLDQLGMPYSWKNIDLEKGEHKSSRFRELNPLCELPVLCHGERILYDSLSIAEYLGSLSDSYEAWFGSNSQEAATHRMWLALESGTHKEFKPLWERHVLKRAQAQDFVAQESMALQRVDDQIRRVESALQVSNWLGGNNIRYADLAWFSRIDSLLSVPGFSLAKMPAIERWYQRVTELSNQKTALA